MIVQVNFNIKNESTLFEGPILDTEFDLKTPDGPIKGTIVAFRRCRNPLCSSKSPECSFLQLTIDTGSPGKAKTRQGGDNLRTRIGGQLNPTWVEWLMGWPIGWTDLKPLEMAKFHLWQRQHGGF